MADIENTAAAGQTVPAVAPVSATSTGGILSLEKIRGRDLTRRVHIKSLDADVVIRKLPASLLERKDIDDISPMVLALTEGVVEPKITEEIIGALTFEEASEITEAVEKFNPNILSGTEEAAADRRKAFPSGE